MLDFSHTHFELFGLPATYALDRERLDAAYRELQGKVHPDRFAAQPEARQRVAMQWATRVNEAYQTLKHPITRGAYLLQLEGIDPLAATNTFIAPAFLTQQMEWREAIADARMEKNRDAASESVRKLKFMDRLIAEAGDAYEELEA